MWKRILALALLCCTLCGCMSLEERWTARSLVWAEKRNFIAQARAQYGKKVRVRNVKAVVNPIWNSLWPVIDSYAIPGSLRGTVVQPDGVEFYAKYYPEDNVIYSTKNHDAIRESVRDFPGLDRFDYLDIRLERNYDSDLSYLPDDLLTFEELLERRYVILAYLLTTDDITGLTEEDFADLFRAYERYEDDWPGYVVLIQLEDPQVLTEDPSMLGKLSQASFQYSNSHGTIYDHEAKTYVDPFDKYGITASLYISSPWSSVVQDSFAYNYSSGVETEEEALPPETEGEEESLPEAGEEPPPETEGEETSPESEKSGRLSRPSLFYAIYAILASHFKS